MNIRVLAFARVREILGASESAIETGSGATAREVWRMLCDRYAALAPFDSSIRFARNGNIVAADSVLQDGDELALLPPVSGG